MRAPLLMIPVLLARPSGRGVRGEGTCRLAAKARSTARDTAAAGWVLCLSAILCLGCGSGSGLRECRGQSDCRSDQVCQAGYCIDLCQSRNDCSYPRICEQGFCVMPESCRVQESCDYDEACVGGYCIPQTPECNDVLDCPPGQTCDRGACVLRPEEDDAGDVFECNIGDDCPPHHQCLDHLCVLVSSDPVPDQGDPGEDSPGDGLGDLESDGDFLLDSELEGPDTTDECEGRNDGRLGDPCQRTANCCNGLCLGDPETSQGICTEVCETYDDCNPAGLAATLFCYEIASGSRYCAPSDYGETCSSPDTCTGGVCLHGNGTSGCSWLCEYTVECPSASACGLVSFWDESSQTVVNINTCSPVGVTCTVDSGSGLNTCLSGICITDENPLVGFCSTFCNTYDPAPCPDSFECQVIDEEYPPVCVP